MFDKIKFKLSIPKRFCEATDNLCIPKCEILRLYKFEIMIVYVVTSKVSLGEGDENDSTTIVCLTLKVNKFVRTQYFCHK